MFYRTLACLPALTGAWRHRGGGVFQSVGSWQDALVDDAALGRPDLLAGREVRTLNMSRLGEILLDEQPPVRGDDRLELESARDRSERRAGTRRDGPRRPVHGRARAVPHRHGASTPTSCSRRRPRSKSNDVTPAWGHLWMGWNEAAIEPLGEAVSNTECFRRIAGCDGPDRTVAVRRRPDDPARRACRTSTSTRSAVTDG